MDLSIMLASGSGDHSEITETASSSQIVGSSGSQDTFLSQTSSSSVSAFNWSLDFFKKPVRLIFGVGSTQHSEVELPTNVDQIADDAEICVMGQTAPTNSTMLSPDQITNVESLQAFDQPDYADDFVDIELGGSEERATFDNPDMAYASILNNILPNSSIGIIVECGSIVVKKLWLPLKRASCQAINSIMNGLIYLTEFAQQNYGKFKDWVKAKWDQNQVVIQDLKGWIEEVGDKLDKHFKVFFASFGMDITQLVTSGYSKKPEGKVVMLTSGFAFAFLVSGHLIHGRKRTLSGLLHIFGVVTHSASYFLLMHSAF